MNNRQTMRASNKRAVSFLLKKGFNDIWLKAHTRKPDLVRTQGGNYYALDLWRLFDGICFDRFGLPCFFQIKTNRFPPTVPIEIFLKNKNGCRVLAINVKTKRNRDILIREYQRSKEGVLIS